LDTSLRKNRSSQSIKKSLIIALSTLIGITLIAVYLISFFATRKEINEVFDANMVKSSRLIFGLMKNGSIKENEGDLSLSFDSELEQKVFHHYEYRIHSQAWKNGKLIYNSDENLIVPIPENDGFSDIAMNERDWRGFSFYDEKSHIRILVLENHHIRNALSLEILLSLIVPLLFSFIPLLTIIITTINGKFKILDLLAVKIQKMSGNSLEQFRDNNVPLELKPFVKSFNQLLTKLADSMESERRFTDYAAHELKTPLAAIKIQAQLLLRNKNKDREKEYLENLIDGTNRASHMVNQLLTLSRLEPENRNIEKEQFDLAKTAEFILQSYEGKMSTKNLTAEFNSTESVIKANKIYIEILLRNLIDNAIKYSTKGSNICVNISAKKIKISNHGAAISKEERAKIFNKFYRTNHSDLENEMSCGLGLAIVKKIVDIHQGNVVFESKGGVNMVRIFLELPNE
jgi:two-component system, OmpR family, sensor histidine kinase QseC